MTHGKEKNAEMVGPPARASGFDRRGDLPRAAGMARSVVLKKSPRCLRCQLAPRWCICAGHREITSPLRIDVLQHYMESYRPSSTGHLVQRVLPGSGRHIFRAERPLARADLAQPGRELWILHPQGGPLPARADPAALQVLLLDGTWVQAAEMARTVGAWGRRVNLPMAGRSRYWLRAQSDTGRFSTAEALIFLLGALGLAEAQAGLRVQFELHVYASLCARGCKQLAADYLVDSPLPAALPDLLAELARRRPNDSKGGSIRAT
jgi:DTW domain-containing protein YfiP